MNTNSEGVLSSYLKGIESAQKSAQVSSDANYKDALIINDIEKLRFEKKMKNVTFVWDNYFKGKYDNLTKNPYLKIEDINSDLKEDLDRHPDIKNILGDIKFAKDPAGIREMKKTVQISPENTFLYPGLPIGEKFNITTNIDNPGTPSKIEPALSEKDKADIAAKKEELSIKKMEIQSKKETTHPGSGIKNAASLVVDKALSAGNSEGVATGINTLTDMINTNKDEDGKPLTYADKISIIAERKRLSDAAAKSVLLQTDNAVQEEIKKALLKKYGKK